MVYKNLITDKHLAVVIVTSCCHGVANMYTSRFTESHQMDDGLVCVSQNGIHQLFGEKPIYFAFHIKLPPTITVLALSLLHQF